MAIKECKDHTFQDFFIPEYMESGVNDYVSMGLGQGSFLKAIICNDLKAAVMAADHVNMRNIPAYVEYFYNHAPFECWGSNEKYDAWVAKGGINGH